MPEIRMIPVDLIDPHPHNPRRDLGDLTELAASIKAHGIRQNLLLVPNRDRYLTAEEEERHGLGAAGMLTHAYTAVIGHRRLSAARLAGLTEVPAAVNALPDLLADSAELERLRGVVEQVREWVNRRGVNVDYRDDDYMDGYRAAQRHALHDAQELLAILDGRADDE